MRFPFPIPDGWFQLAWSHELTDGVVRSVRAFGRELVLFRGPDGAPALLDAYCPHLGAHLGHGGRVEQGELVCPFHAWRFGADGRCAAVPYATRIPARAALATLPVCERNGAVYGFHHGLGARPTWEIPQVPEANDPDYGPARTFTFTIRTHNQEIGENAVDRAHFRYVHGTLDVPTSTLALDGHVRRAVQHVSYATPRGPVPGTIEVEAHGMGFTVTRFRGIVETALLISHTPIDGDSVFTRFTFFQPRARAGSRVADAVVREVVRQLEEDIPIWEHKRYLATPRLCDGDGPIGEYRAWATQFYSAGRGDPVS